MIPSREYYLVAGSCEHNNDMSGSIEASSLLVETL